MPVIRYEDLKDRFSYHPPTSEDVSDLHDDIRENSLTLASFLVDQLPESRELSLAITHVEEAMFWANAALARNQKSLGNTE